jgi:hypothetical protein
MGIRLVGHSRLRLRQALADGLIDQETYAEAAALMDSLGVPDGAQVAFDEEDWQRDLQGWLDAMPLRYSAATRRKYGRYAVRFIEHLGEAGLSLEDVTEDHIRAWAHQRQRGRAPITWEKEEQALMSLLGWLASPRNPRRLYDSSPWPVWQSGNRTTSAVSRPSSTLSPRVRMLDATEWAWFRNVGLGGRHGAASTHRSVMPPRYPQRDLALGDLLVTAGARISEARCLLIDEVPQPTASQRARPWPNTMLFLGGARAKTRGGFTPFLPEVGDRLWAWWESALRQAIVDSAQQTLKRRLRDGTLFVVEEVSADRGMHSFAGTWLGADARWTADLLPADAAEAAVRRDGSRLLPLTLWQTDANGGQPMSGTALRDVFSEATARAAASTGHPLRDDLLRWRRASDGSRTVTGGVTPHMARHTAAVNWLVDLTLEARRRHGRGRTVRHVNLPSSGVFDPMYYVQVWLRHVDPQTSQQYQTWVNRQDWPEARSLGHGSLALITDWEPGQ